MPRNDSSETLHVHLSYPFIAQLSKYFIIFSIISTLSWPWFNCPFWVQSPSSRSFKSSNWKSRKRIESQAEPNMYWTLICILQSLLYISLSLSLWLTKFLFMRIDATTKLYKELTLVWEDRLPRFTQGKWGGKGQNTCIYVVNKGEMTGPESWESSQTQCHLLKKYFPLRCIDNALTFSISQNICHNCSCWTPGFLWGPFQHEHLQKGNLWHLKTARTAYRKYKE